MVSGGCPGRDRGRRNSGCSGGPAARLKYEALRDAAVREMKQVFGDDERRIRHALAVLDYAQRILQRERGDPLVVMAAAVLHDIGIAQAERKYNSAAGKWQEIEGPPIARGILEKLDVDSAAVGHVCRIIANHHSARDIDTPEFRILWDADWLVNIPEEFPRASRAHLEEIISRVFKTATGNSLARSLLLAEN